MNYPLPSSTSLFLLFFVSPNCVACTRKYKQLLDTLSGSKITPVFTEQDKLTA